MRTEMADPLFVGGGPTPDEAAAVAVVIEAVLEDEAAARAKPAVPPRQSAWVLAWRPREAQAPLPSHSYDAQPWSELDVEANGDEP